MPLCGFVKISLLIKKKLNTDIGDMRGKLNSVVSIIVMVLSQLYSGVGQLLLNTGITYHKEYCYSNARLWNSMLRHIQ